MEYILQHPELGNVESTALQEDYDDYLLKVFFTEKSYNSQKFEEDEARVLAEVLHLEAVLAVRYFIAGKTFSPKKTYHYLSIRSGDKGQIYSSWEATEASASYFNSESEAEAVLKTLEILDSIPNFSMGCKVYSTDDYLD